MLMNMLDCLVMLATLVFIVLVILMCLIMHLIMEEVHPVTNCMLLLLVSFCYINLIYFYTSKSLISFMILIVFVSGVMVLFSYFISLINKPVMFFSMKFLSLILFFFGLFVYLFNKYVIVDLVFLNDFIHGEFNLPNDLFINIVYSNFNGSIFICMMIFLVLVLFICYMISIMKGSSFRQFKI
uniref:NADH dehydrogenase subunit 6 n=1 Tax=Amegilla calceifera TaxID=597987 RepID=A0A7U0R6A9_9HYME|nr:NADH dehydrogenase subunit 6 [Amegilla calceifera]QQX28009.1 NADH dehydrogenase subunit 6 [Amegilla calceifera]